MMALRYEFLELTVNGRNLGQFIDLAGLELAGRANGDLAMSWPTGHPSCKRSCRRGFSRRLIGWRAKCQTLGMPVGSRGAMGFPVRGPAPAA
jgi:hypothetical protein